MSGLLCVLPVMPVDDATTAVTERCLRSVLAPDSAAGLDPSEILVVDNSRHGYDSGLRTHRDPNGHNLGVARAWNVGAAEVLERDLDYLVIMSASMQFGPILHTTWRHQMETFWGETVIEADGHSWHLIALHRRIFETIGLFDPNFYPAYFEQIDFGYRMRMHRMEAGFRRVWVNALSQGSALHNQAVSCPAGPLLDYYRDKWGGDKGEETFVQPFGDRPIDWWPEASIPELAARYGLVTWW